MKHLITIFVLIVLALLTGCKSSKSTLPRDIYYSKLPDGKHKYLIRNIFFDEKEKEEDDEETNKEKHERWATYGLDEDETKTHIDPKKKTLTIITNKPIENLQEYCNQRAAGSGLIPYWDELLMRDKENDKFDPEYYQLMGKGDFFSFPSPVFVDPKKNASPAFRALIQSISKNKDNSHRISITLAAPYPKTKSYLVDFILRPWSKGYLCEEDVEKGETPIKFKDLNKSFLKNNIPIRLPGNKTGTLVYNATTAFCMGHSSLALRILDENGECLWKYAGGMQGDISLATYDFDNDGVDEIVVFYQGHGMELLIFQNKYSFENNKAIAPKATKKNLFKAVALGDCELVKMILEDGVDVNSKNKDAETTLILASQEDNVEIVELLLNKGADINAIDSFGSNSLLKALDFRCNNVAKFLIEKGINIQYRESGTGENALMQASRNGDNEMIEYLLKKGIKINDATLLLGKTALMIAARYNHVKAAKLLLEKGADISMETKFGRSALTWAVSEGKVDTAKLLNSHGQYLKFNGLKDSVSKELSKAIIHNKPEQLKKLLKQKIPLNVEDKCGLTPLMISANLGYKDLVQLLIDHGAKISYKNKGGITALIQQAKTKSGPEMTKLLIKNGADVNAQDNYGKTSLMWASGFRRRGIAEVLLENGAKIDIKDKKGKSVLDHDWSNSCTRLFEKYKTKQNK